MLPMLPEYAARFGATRIIHRADAEAMPDAEWIVDGLETVGLAPEFSSSRCRATRRAAVRCSTIDRFLFTGDHLWWDPETRSLEAPRRLVWRSRAMVQSIEKLLNYRFEWVLAGHGDRIRLSPAEMTEAATGFGQAPVHSCRSVDHLII